MEEPGPFGTGRTGGVFSKWKITTGRKQRATSWELPGFPGHVFFLGLFDQKDLI